jgi:tRNA dimethylallyltransferase
MPETGMTYSSGMPSGDTAHRPDSLLVIVGPTASGKTRLGLEVAEALGGEIVSADAFAVYRGLDIGTDKPDEAARRRVRHHLIDIADPRVRFSAGAFVEAASTAISDIRARGRTPLVVGGSHFWIRALLLGLFPAPARDDRVVNEIARQYHRDPEGTYSRLETVDPVAAAKIGPRDHHRVLRALEVFETTGRPISEHWSEHRRSTHIDPLLVAPERSRPELYAKIELRVDAMFASGFVEEVRRILGSGVPRDAHALKAIGYRQLVDHLEGSCDLETAIRNTKAASRRLAKRQLTWLRGLTEGELHWLPPAEAGGVEATLELWLGTREKRGRR